MAESKAAEAWVAASQKAIAEAARSVSVATPLTSANRDRETVRG